MKFAYFQGDWQLVMMWHGTRMYHVSSVDVDDVAWSPVGCKGSVDVEEATVEVVAERTKRLRAQWSLYSSSSCWCSGYAVSMREV
jgi:hypothetical protein